MFYPLIKRLGTETRLGKRVVSYFLPEQYRKKFSALYKEKSRARMIRKICRDSSSQIKDLFHTCLEHVSPVTQPLVLISQIRYSGGMLLNQLFDGHAEIHCHPHRLSFGSGPAVRWPEIDIQNDPRLWFDMLFESFVIELAQKGYCPGSGDEEQTLPFIFLPSLQKDIFLACIDPVASVTARDIFNAYMTSYFGAWLNYYHGSGSIKYVIAYAPGMSLPENNVENFFEIYPDGRLVSIIRDPKDWFVSAQGHAPKQYGGFEKAINQWVQDARAMLRNSHSYGDQVRIVRFEDLIGKTDNVMACLSKFLGIEFSEISLVPTFNQIPLKVHADFAYKSDGMDKGLAARYDSLNSRQLETIEKITGGTYARVLDEAVRLE